MLNTDRLSDVATSISKTRVKLAICHRVLSLKGIASRSVANHFAFYLTLKSPYDKFSHKIKVSSVVIVTIITKHSNHYGLSD